MQSGRDESLYWTNGTVKAGGAISFNWSRFMSIEQFTPERIGITAFVILYITKEVGVPLALKLFPQLFKRSDREQAREDKKLDFDQQMKLREIEAWETIAKYQGDIRDILGIMNERNHENKDKLDQILARLTVAKKKQ
jgi:hypothetical protein